MNDRQSSEYLSTLEKGLRVLKSFSRDRSKMTLSEVARATDLNPAVARRCLITLLEMGYVGKVDNTFFLRPQVLELSTPFIESFNIDNVIRPPLQQLRDQTGDSASFAVLSGSASRHSPPLWVVRFYRRTPMAILTHFSTSTR